MKLKKIVPSLLLCFWLAACVSEPTYVYQPKPLLDTDICCADFSKFPWIALEKQDEFNFEIDDSAPVGKFLEGNSYFNAFELPKNAKKVQLRLVSKMLDGEVFAPKVIALDKDFNIVETRELDSFDLRAADAFTRNQYLLNMMLDTDKTPYFVIYTKATEVGKSIQVEHPAKIRAKSFGEPMPMVVDPKYIFTQTGKFSLRLGVVSLKGYTDVAKNF